MGIKERRERERDETRQRILDSARRLFVTHGYEAVSLRKIADAIEYSPAAVYVHFRDKQDLIRAMVLEDFSRLDGEALELAAIADPIERIRQIGMRYIHFGLANPHHYKLMFMTPPPASSMKDTGVEEALDIEDPSKSAYGLLKAAVAEAYQRGLLSDEHSNAGLSAQMLWASVHGVTSLVIAMRDDPCVKFSDVPGLAKLMCDTVLRGMVVKGAQL
jgi:AcrR family transcriptional regulator